MMHASTRWTMIPGNADFHRYLEYFVPPVVVPGLIAAVVIAFAAWRWWEAW